MFWWAAIQPAAQVQMEEDPGGLARPLSQASTLWVGCILEPLGNRKAKVNTPHKGGNQTWAYRGHRVVSPDSFLLSLLSSDLVILRLQALHTVQSPKDWSQMKKGKRR